MRGGYGALGASGHREPSSLARGRAISSWGPDWGGPAELGCGELRVGSAPVRNPCFHATGWCPPGSRSVPAQTCCPLLKQNDKDVRPSRGSGGDRKAHTCSETVPTRRLFNLAVYVEVSGGSCAVVKNSTQRAQVRAACLPP